MDQDNLNTHLFTTFVVKSFQTFRLFLLLLLFFITACILNVVQLINYLLFEVTVPQLRRWINFYLQDIILSSVIQICELQCGIRFRLNFDSNFTASQLAKPNTQALLIANHSYELDAILYWMATQEFGQLGSIKAFIKKGLEWMPIVGWLAFFNDSIVLARNWSKDEKNIEKGLNRLASCYSPYLLVIAPEGTRYTEAKYQNSLEFIKKNNVPIAPLKHHLLPRVKGFSTTLRHLQKIQGQNVQMYNMEFVCNRQSDHTGSIRPSLNSFISGEKFQVDCYIEQIQNLPDPASEDTEYANLLYRIFERKDELVDQHRLHGKFPGSHSRLRKPNFIRLIQFVLFNIILSGSLLCYAFYWVHFVSQNFALKCLIWTAVSVIYAAIYSIFKMAELSNYGNKN